MTQAPTPAKRSLRWWQILLLIVIWPAGLTLALIWMWRNAKVGTGAKLLTTTVAVFVAPFVALVCFGFTLQAIYGPAVRPTPTVTTAAPAPSPTAAPSQPEMDTYTFDQYGVSVLIPKGWRPNGIGDPDTGAMFTGPDSDSWSTVLVAIGTGKETHAGTPDKQVTKAIDALSDGGQKITMKHVDDRSYEIRAKGGGLITHEYLFVAKERDYLLVWTYETAAETEFGPQADWSIKSFEDDIEKRG